MERHRPQFNINRIDVAKVFSDYENALCSGFRGNFQVGMTGKVEIFLEFTLSNDETIELNVKDGLLSRPSPWQGFLILIHSFNWLRITNAFRFLMRGDISGLKAKVQFVIDKGTRYTTQYSNLKSLLPAFQDKPLEPILLNKEIDIIIPVYNGYEFLGPLFNAILKNTPTPDIYPVGIQSGPLDIVMQRFSLM